MAEKKPLIILTGPTAVGKTRLSILLAKKIGGEIISADSMQVYRHMDIGSAKIPQEEMDNVPHHMIDILDPREDFNVLRFQEEVKKCLKEIYSRGGVPILAGGTGFYIQAVLYDIDFTQNRDNEEIRSRLEQFAAERGSEELHSRLAAVDPVSAEMIHANNIKRVVRALEFYELTGKRISEHNEEQHERTSAYDSCYFVLNDNRQELYRRIDRRVDEMVEAGLLDEVIRLKEMGCRRDMVSMQGLGYKELLDYLDGLISLEEAVYRIKRDTRHFAKRQLTWFRRERDVIWVEKSDFAYNEEKMAAYMVQKIREKAGIGEHTL